MKIFRKLVIALISTGYLFNMAAQETAWTHFRGSRLDAVSLEKTVPVSWNDQKGIAWKVPVDGKGWSSPVVYNNQIWVTTATDDGKEMYALCYDFASGRQLFKVKVFEPGKVQSKHNINTYATPTPCIENNFVYIHFGTYGTACLKTADGSVVWKRTDLNCEHVQGPGSSPVIYKNMLILHIEGTDVQYIIALDKKTGNTIWKTDRPKECYDKLTRIGKKAYITPLIVNVNGRDLLISNGSAVCIAYDPITGKEVWRFVEGEDSTIAMPFAENGMVYFITSFVTPPEGVQYCELVAVDPSGSGDIAATHLRWRIKLSILQLSTPVIRNGLIYMVDTKNNLLCINASDGTTVYSDRLREKYNSSPVIAAGNIYYISINGEVMVVKEGKTPDIIARSNVEGEVYATPAILNKSIIIRTSDYLYRISE
jgi:outer membrane protein assembly factor BamB